MFWDIMTASEIDADTLRARGLDPENADILRLGNVYMLEDSPPETPAGSYARRVGDRPVPVWEEGVLTKWRWNYEIVDMLAEEKAVKTARLEELHAACLREEALVSAVVGGRTCIPLGLTVLDAAWLALGSDVILTVRNEDGSEELATASQEECVWLARKLAGYAAASFGMRQAFMNSIESASTLDEAIAVDFGRRGWARELGEGYGPDALNPWADE